MKLKIFKFIKVTLIVLFVVIAGLLTYVKTALPNVGAPLEIKVAASPEMIARGAYLANHVMVCMDCHSKRDWSKFSGPISGTQLGCGGEIFDQRFGFPGKFVSKNITPFNLGKWTDGEIFRAITTGVNKDNKALFPVMPFKSYAQLDEEDIKAVIAYIRTLTPIEQTNAESVPDFPMNFIINTIPSKANLQKRPDPADAIAYGKYITTAAACRECHTKQDKGQYVGDEFAGGFEFDFGNGKKVVSANITPHASGIGAWSKADFVKRFKAFSDSAYTLPNVNLDKQEFQTVMPWSMYTGMTTQDLEAIYDYLKSQKPSNNVVVRFADTKK